MSYEHRHGRAIQHALPYARNGFPGEFPANNSQEGDINVIMQRLMIRATHGRLQVIPVWQCLSRNGAKVCRWSVRVDRKTGGESMTVDIAIAGPHCTANIIATLGEAPLNMSVTPLPSAVVSDHQALA
ncbi:hypothetical protein [Paraburkholderia sacchari]|uniref:hypothetical protein n=1 Tax=Paraburkholderia sacchari TaxID=159450 RepID=UPI001BCED6BE|nr:hypothetical protein [Paraburkholderia sacchari]